MTFIYDAEEVAVGDTWENMYNGKLSAKNTWTLNAIEEENTIISGNASVTMNVKEPATTMSLNGVQSTEVIANSKNGFIKFMKVASEAKGISKMTELGDEEIPTTIKSIITYELIE
jgi:hypothetical protein